MILLKGAWSFLTGLPWQVWIAIGAAAACYGCFLGGEHHTQAKWDAEIEASKKHVEVVKTKQADVTSSVDRQVTTKQVEIKTVFKDRIIYRDKQVSHETVAKEDAACVIPNRVVGMWNSANRGSLPDPASELDEAASGVQLSDISAQHEFEAEANRLNVEQIKGWQKWASEQMLVK